MEVAHLSVAVTVSVRDRIWRLDSPSSVRAYVCPSEVSCATAVLARLFQGARRNDSYRLSTTLRQRVTERAIAHRCHCATGAAG